MDISSPIWTDATEHDQDDDVINREKKPEDDKNRTTSASAENHPKLQNNSDYSEGKTFICESNIKADTVERNHTRLGTTKVAFTEAEAYTCDDW